MGFITIIILTQIMHTLCQEPIIQTQYGKIQGNVGEFNSKKYSYFLGVPFAAPPIANLRFKPPQAPVSWNNSVLSTQQFGPACAQPEELPWNIPLWPQRYHLATTYDEDCLYLNIYVPSDITDDSRDVTALPVLVFIHGGGFVTGESSFQQGEALVTMTAHPVVVVTIQYRLGVFGFLTSGDDVISGNLGLKDQVFALKWIQNNIGYFGGDPHQVTITGESAGAESVLAHMVSPMSAGLFQKASAQSPGAAWIYPRNSLRKKYFLQLAETLGCETASSTSEEIVECMQEKPWRDLSYAVEPRMELLGTRVIDGEFIVEEPRVSWANGHYHDVDLMYGLTSDDGHIFVEFGYISDFLTNRSEDFNIMTSLTRLELASMFDENFDHFPTDEITYNGQILDNFDALQSVLIGRYYDAGTSIADKGRRLLDCSRDGMMFIFGFNAATQIAKHGRNQVHAYMFDHRSDVYPNSGENGMELGAFHGSELAFQFGYGFTDPEEAPMSTEELMLSRSIMHAWTSYASGSPSFLDMSGEEIDWPQFTEDSHNALMFDTTMSPASITDVSTTWSRVLEFWLAVQSLSSFENHVAEPVDPDSPYPPSTGTLWMLTSQLVFLMPIMNLLF